MAIETQPERAHGAGGSGRASRRQRPWWMRPAIHTAIVGAVIGYLIGHWLGNFLAASNVNTEYPNIALSDSSDWPIVLGYALAIVGWLAGRALTRRPRSRCWPRSSAREWRNWSAR